MFPLPVRFLESSICTTRPPTQEAKPQAEPASKGIPSSLTFGGEGGRGCSSCGAQPKEL